MTELMTAVVLDGRGGVELVEKPVPQPMDGEILIAPHATGVCGTDLHLIDGTFSLARYPVTPGHEFAGVVAGVGAGVTGFHEGDLVCADPNVTCGTCRWCRVGALNHCPELDPLGLTRDGACAEYVSVPQVNVFALPSGVTPEVGALIEPLSCVLHAARRTPGWSGARVAVFGAGPIGLPAIAAAPHRGAASVVGFALHGSRAPGAPGRATYARPGPGPVAPWAGGPPARTPPRAGAGGSAARQGGPRDSPRPSPPRCGPSALWDACPRWGPPIPPCPCRWHPVR